VQLGAVVNLVGSTCKNGDNLFKFSTQKLIKKLMIKSRRKLYRHSGFMKRWKTVGRKRKICPI